MASAHFPAEGRGQSITATILATVVACALLLPGILYGPSQDAAVYASVAVRLRAGGALYADAWDHKPPGAYLIDAAAQSVLPWFGAWVPIWLISVLAVVICALVVHAVLGLCGQSPRIRLAGALFVTVALALPPIAQGGGHTEHLALVPAAAAFALATHGTRNRAFIGSGILLGVALLISLQLASAVAAVAALASIRGPRTIRLAYVAAGLAVPWLVTALLLAWAGLLPDAWDAVVRYSAAYRSMNLAFQGPIFAGALGAGIRASAVAMIPIGLGIIWSLRTSGAARGVAVGCVTWLSAGVAWIAFQGRLEGHYVAPLVIPAGIFFAMGLSRLIGPPLGQSRAILLFGVPIAALAALSAVVVIGASRVVWAELAAENRSAHEVAVRIASGSTGEATVFVWGNRTQVYYLADRAPASRYLYLAPLTTPGYSSPAQVADVLGGWKQAPPEFIVDAGSSVPGAPGLQPLLLPRPISGNGRDYDVLGPLREFVRERYALLGIVEGWPIYELTSGHPPR